MAKSDRSSQNPYSLSDAEDCDVDSFRGHEGQLAGGQAQSSDAASGIGPETREERLRRIQQDVKAGKYDSDEMLEEALEIMLKKIASDPE